MLQRMIFFQGRSIIVLYLSDVTRIAVITTTPKYDLNTGDPVYTLHVVSRFAGGLISVNISQ